MQSSKETKKAPVTTATNDSRSSGQPSRMFLLNLEAMIPRGPSMPSECWLEYDSKKAIKIDRQKVASTCAYFDILLNGPYKEGRETVIDMKISNMFSYEAFACIINYANHGTFVRDPDAIDMHIEAIQLCILWDYVDCKEVIEYQLMAVINAHTITDLLGLAYRHKYALGRLKEACEEWERTVPYETSVPLNWTIRCIVDEHQKHPHHHMNCSFHTQEKKRRQEEEESFVKTFWNEDDVHLVWKTPQEIAEEEERAIDLREKRNAGFRGTNPYEYLGGRWKEFLA